MSMYLPGIQYHFEHMDNHSPNNMALFQLRHEEQSPSSLLTCWHCRRAAIPDDGVPRELCVRANDGDFPSFYYEICLWSLEERRVACDRNSQGSRGRNVGCGEFLGHVGCVGEYGGSFCVLTTLAGTFVSTVDLLHLLLLLLLSSITWHLNK